MKIRKTDRERVLLSITKSNIQNSANYYFAEASENRETVPFSAERNTHMDGLRTDCKKNTDKHHAARFCHIQKKSGPARRVCRHNHDISILSART